MNDEQYSGSLDANCDISSYGLGIFMAGENTQPHPEDNSHNHSKLYQGNNAMTTQQPPMSAREFVIWVDKKICEGPNTMQDVIDGLEQRDAALIASAAAEKAELVEALREVQRVFESETTAIVDTVWVSDGRPETLYDFVRWNIEKHTTPLPSPDITDGGLND